MERTGSGMAQMLLADNGAGGSIPTIRVKAYIPTSITARQSVQIGTSMTAMLLVRDGGSDQMAR